jgi:oligoribonuclease NrnB/cAMP/cGMP phosphodiesterase (DHH superfamily)
MRYVVIHATDHDGVASAWLFDKHMHREDFVSNVPIEYFGITAGKTDLPEFFPGDHVYIFDRSYPLETLLKLSQTVAVVIVIDHHKTFLDTLAFNYNHSGCIVRDVYTNSGLAALTISVDNLEILCDTRYSACELVADYLDIKISISANRVEDYWFIAYIGDRDIWEFHLPMSKEINAGIHTFPLEFETFYKMFNGEIMPEQCEERGMGILAYQEELFKSLTAVAIDKEEAADGEDIDVTTFTKIDTFAAYGEGDDKPVAIALVPMSLTPLISDLGNYLLTELGFDVAIMWHPVYHPRESNHYSVRSKIDTCHISKELGGGGHALANSFRSVLSPEVIAAKFLRELTK